MSPNQAKQILLLYRPGAVDHSDPEMAEAMDLAERDPALGRWFAQHQAFQIAVQSKLRQVAVPQGLKAELLVRQKLITPRVWWQRTAWLAAAAALALFFGITMVVMSSRPPVLDRFADYRERMVSRAIIDYRMDVKTNDMRQLRQYLVSKGAPGSYGLTKGLEKLHLTGGGKLTWRNQPVGMVCFDRGDTQMLFLFVIAQTACKDPPPAVPQLERVHDRVTASWTEGDLTYMLFGPDDEDNNSFLKKYL